MSYMWQFKAEVQDLNIRVEHIEQKMVEFASSFNTLVDAHNETEDLSWLKSKVVDLGDRSHCNNLRNHEISESM